MMYLQTVTAALDVLIETAKPYDGLFPSIIDRQTHRMMDQRPPHIDGQRDGDRSHLGCNLLHDHVVLHLLDQLGRVLGRADYTATVDRYLARFLSHCTDTPTGLWPWGEHAYWHLIEDRIGNSYVDAGNPNAPLQHDHLRQAPLWLWQRLWNIDHAPVERFADGLDLHWRDDARTEYMRHAHIAEVKRMGGLDADRSCDFPRHGGFYMFDWAFVLARTQNAELAGRLCQNIGRIADYWWVERSATGLLRSERRTERAGEESHKRRMVTQTLSLGVSMLEAAALLADTDAVLATLLRERGNVYLNAALEAGHQYQEAFFVGSCEDDLSNPAAMSIWGSVYGQPNIGAPALLMLAAERETRDARCLAFAEAAGHAQALQPFPADAVVPSRDPGHALCLMMNLHQRTGDTNWIDRAMRLADRVLPIYFDRPLPRAATNADWYESQTIPGFLLYGLAQLGLHHGGYDPIEADFTSHY